MLNFPCLLLAGTGICGAPGHRAGQTALLGVEDAASGFLL